MRIIVSGKQMDVGDSLKSHIEDRLHEGINKYSERITNVQAVVSKEGHRFEVALTANMGDHSGITINSHTQGNDVYSVFEEAATKLEKQLRRYKRRLTNHHKTASTHAETAELISMHATQYTLASDDDEVTEDAPLVIAETPTHIRSMTVSEAVMKMDLADLPAYMFINSAHGRVNVVYRRNDGNITWVDPKAMESAA